MPQITTLAPLLFRQLTLALCLTLGCGCDSDSRQRSEGLEPIPPLPDQATLDAQLELDLGVLDAEATPDLELVDMALEAQSACMNELDDDEDGLVDYPQDPGCASPDDGDERDEGPGTIVAQCYNGLDDDEDGYADLADPDCSDITDPQERRGEGEPTPACSDGVDNDGDGLIDAFEDPGCSHFGDQDELDLEEPPACSNLLDDDRDGLIDYPQDPGCVSLGDLNEADPPSPPACRDGLDNDQDGAIDFPLDLGCESASSLSERPICVGPARVIEARGGLRYTVTSEQGRHGREASCGGRGSPELTLFYRLSYPVKSLKVHSAGSWETTLSAQYRCGEGAELACAREPVGDGGLNELTINAPLPGSYYFTVDGASALGGEATLWVEEVLIEACQDGLDNDGDGLIDAPFDPGCLSPTDEAEETPSPAPQCGDGLDNDEDGQVDYPTDRGCYQASDPSEEDECGAGVLVLPLGGNYPLSLRNSSSRPGQTSELTGSCGQSQGFEAVYVIQNPSHARMTFSLIRRDGVSDEVSMYLRAGDCLSGPELGCSAALLEAHSAGQELPEGATLKLEVESAPQGPLFLIIDHPLDGLPYELTVTRLQLPPRCRDDQDNDADHLIDHEDPGCEGPEDESELDPSQASECHDLLDNDGDGFFDYPYDPGCLYRGGLSELDPDVPPSCSNGVDDNGDGYTDFPYDPGCSARGDEVEAVNATPAECANGRDDDGDGLIDFPYDLGCTGRGDRAERDERWLPQCGDGLDNDGDGAVDFPFDSSCASRGTRSERDNDFIAVCSNGEDDDLDGATDFPFDPGCLSAADDSEGDPELLPLCANLYDDDGNGRVDWPDDPGCSYSADNSEEGVDDPNPRCSDGIDNDLDGAVDLTDSGCVGPFDDDELNADPTPPACLDGLDNDGDGLIDWPLDYGCAGAGDPCEAGGQLLCIEGDEQRCVDVLSSPVHCGACGVSCPEGVECLEGFCGGERPLRSALLSCIYTARPLIDFLIDPLASEPDSAALSTSVSCTPDEDTQALLIPRNATSSLRRAEGTIRRYVQQGGTLITERGRAAQVYELLTGLSVALPVDEYGACAGNPLPVIQRHRDHPIWALSPHSAPLSTETGCGVDLSLLPGVVDLGGWSATTSSLSYLDYGLGRAWFVEADWGRRPTAPSTTEEAGLRLMAAMIRGVETPRHPLLPACRDGVDNDLDGVTDLWDLGCQGRDDMSEEPSSALPEALNDLQALDVTRLSLLRTLGVECHDGLDNDGNGLIDFPYDPGCEAMGDQAERAVEERPECDDGLDNDGDGLIDWPADPGCAGRGALIEGRELFSAPCANERDDDLDGYTDWPVDPACRSPQSLGELRGAQQRLTMSPALLLALNPAGEIGRRACYNRLDDDADGAIDLEDLECTSTLGLSEGPPVSGALPPDAEGEPCADGVDNDQDGATDWPSDLSCLSPYGLEDGDSCVSEDSLRPGELWEGSVDLDSSISDASACAEMSVPSHTLSYEHLGGALTLLLRGAEEDIPVALSVRRSCDEAGEVTCQSADELSLTGALSLADARAGRYLIQASALPAAEWVDQEGPLELPSDAQDFQANHDLTTQCWRDGGRNAFNCMGLMNLHLGERTFPINVREGLHVMNIEGQALHYDSAFIHQNVWRLRWLPPRTQRFKRSFESASLSFSGTVGAGVDSLAVQALTQVDGHELRYLYLADSFIAPTTPPTLVWMVPSEPSMVSEVSYTEEAGHIQTSAPVTSPFTIYVIASYLPREELIQLLKRRVVRRDLRPRVGTFGVTATSGEQP